MTKVTDELLGGDGYAGSREYTLPRSDESSTPKGWIRGGTKIGPVFQFTTNYHQGKPGIQIRIESLSKNGSPSCVRISGGLNVFVRDLTEKARPPGFSDENDSEGTGKPVKQDIKIVKYSHTEADKLAAKAKAKPVPTSAPPSTHSQKSIPIHVREWYDVEPQKWKSKDAQSFAVSKKLIALLRHGTLPRDQDGAVEFRRQKQKIRSGFPYSAHWSIHLWLDHLRTGGGHKKRFQFCTNYTGSQILYLRAIQGHSGENSVYPALLDNVLILNDFLSTSIMSGVVPTYTPS